jgi:MOSC domain-containing protein YiiM
MTTRNPDRSVHHSADSTRPADRTSQRGHLVQVSVGRPQPVDRQGRLDHTAIFKTAVDGPVRAAGINLDGDDQADRDVHGGYDKAIYAYAEEDRWWWESETGRTIERAAFGENLTTGDIDVTSAVIGERWAIGTAVLEVSEPRLPCWKLNLRMGDDSFVRRFNAAGRPGTYLRIITSGDLRAGDSIHVVHVPDHGVTVNDVARIRRDRAGAEVLLTLDSISDEWKRWAARAVSR